MVVKPTKFLCRIEPKLLDSRQDALFNLEPSNMRAHFRQRRISLRLSLRDQRGLLRGCVNNPNKTLP